MIYIVDVGGKIVHSKMGSVKLTGKELSLFIAMIENASNGNKIHRKELLSFIWPEREMVIGNNNINQLFCRLKKKIVLISDDFEFQSLRGGGYKIKSRRKISAYKNNSQAYNLLRVLLWLQAKILNNKNKL